jgi:hypothetical protein
MNKKLLRLFFWWIKERQLIYMRRLARKPEPWTKDPILQTYKFTNVFRQQDRVTQEWLKLRKLTKNRKGMEELYFNIILFRFFNWPQSYDAIGGWCKEWNGRKAAAILRKRKKEGRKVITGAYMITNMGRTGAKTDMMCKALTKIWQTHKEDARKVWGMKTIEESVAFMTEYPMVGRFVAYEFATDMRHTAILENAEDIFTWANAGPGCKRGLNRLHKRDIRTKPHNDQCVHEMILIMKAQKEFLPKEFPLLEMRDIEHSLCEFDKYCRAKFGEGRPRSKFTPWRYVP